ACPGVKDFTDWLAAIEKGDASRAVDIIDGKGCVGVNKGEMVEFERLLTHPFVVCVRPIGQSQCFWTLPFAISPQPQKRWEAPFGAGLRYASSSPAMTARWFGRDRSPARRGMRHPKASAHLILSRGSKRMRWIRS